MRVLLDTHTLLWAVLDPASLSATCSRLIADESTIVMVSVGSAWEIATKVRLGKLPGAEAFEADFLEVIEEADYTLLAIEAADALRAGRLAGEHKDPFDRVLAAQALSRDIPMLSRDAKLDGFGVRRIW